MHYFLLTSFQRESSKDYRHEPLVPSIKTFLTFLIYRLNAKFSVDYFVDS
jgi:hypothetical protein